MIGGPLDLPYKGADLDLARLPKYAMMTEGTASMRSVGSISITARVTHRVPETQVMRGAALRDTVPTALPCISMQQPVSFKLHVLSRRSDRWRYRESRIAAQIGPNRQGLSFIETNVSQSSCRDSPAATYVSHISCIIF